MTSSTDLAATYAALILADEGIEITPDKILTLTTAAGIDLEPIWASLLAKALQDKNVKDLLVEVGSTNHAYAPLSVSQGVVVEVSQEEPGEKGMGKEVEREREEEQDSDDDFAFSLFD